jgi:hypothetical protein
VGRAPIGGGCGTNGGENMNHWSFGVSASVLLVALALWVGAGWLCWANWQRNGRRRVVAWLEGLRFLLITLLAFTLLRPEWVSQIHRTDRPEVAILLDGSASMNTRDLIVSNKVVTRATWIEQQRTNGFWNPLEKSARLAVEDFATPATRTNATATAAASNTDPEEGTDLNHALESVLQRQRNLQALLLLSDGDWNLGKSPLSAATRFRDQGVPIFSVTVGREMPLPDLSLEPVTPPAFGLFGEQISIPFRIVSHLPRTVKTTIALLDERNEETKKEIVIPAMGELQDAILWLPTSVGDASLRLKLPLETDEALAENNEQKFRINVRVETLKVLVVDSMPRWEYRFLRNALARDPGVELHCVLFHPSLGPGGGRHYLPAFPGSKEQLSRYDVIFLGDVGIGENELSAQDAELLKGLIEQQASGLVFLPGRRGRQLTFLNSALKDLIPVVLDESRPQGVSLQNESVLLMSSIGKGHLLTRFDADENHNDEIWKQLPGFFWSAAVEKSRPGSEVLGVHSSLRNAWGRIPLLVTRAHGNGKVLFMGTDSAWRWRRGVEDKYHYRFWGQVVRWMAHQRHLAEKEGIRLSYSPETPRLGDTIYLQATVLDSTGFPIERGAVSGKITTPAGRSERLDFTAVEGGWGVFNASFTPQDGGPFKISIASEEHQRRLETEINVIRPVREKQGQPANASILRHQCFR